jgi:diguanylate cyclase (GGDEF)-like protein/PAS domain S-box-containing protein
MSDPTFESRSSLDWALQYRGRALWEALAVALAMVAVAGASVFGLWEASSPALLGNAHNWKGAFPAGALIALLSIGFYRVRLKIPDLPQQSLRWIPEQQRCQKILEAAHVGSWEAHIGNDEILVDNCWAAMLGRTPQDLNPISRERLCSPELMHPQDIASTLASIANVHEQDKVFQIDVRMRHAAGYWIWVEVRGKVVQRDELGRPLRVVGTQMEVGARKHVELALTDSESAFRSLFELSPVGIVLCDHSSGQFLQVNDAMVASTGYAREELLQRTYMDITPPEWHERESNHVAVLETSGHFDVFEKEYQRRDGSRYPVLVSGTRVRDASGRDVVWAIVQDISARKAMESKLEDAARRDKLTGLANRTVFQERLQAAVERVRSGQQERFAVLFLDFDRFKLVNDAMGHEAGDGLLCELASRLQVSLRECDERLAAPDSCLVARFGGDEFLILINDLQDRNAAEQIADQLLVSLAQTYTVRGRDVYSTASIGIVTSEQCLESADAVVRNADVAMYEAKRSGRACAVMFDETMRTRLTRQVTVESNLRKALETTEISLVYQPIVELATGRTISVEALARWHHPILGQVSPAEFIPVAEESGLIVALGQWVLQEACSALAAWRAQDPLRAPQKISVNVSRAELALGERLLLRVRAALENTGLPAKCLQLEVTEREVMRDPEVTLKVMGVLRDMGVGLAMDDFGTGTSSLSCLRDYPFDVIKIDRSFVQDVATNSDVLAVIRATVRLVEHLGKKSVAEGVETREQAEVLKTLGCHYVQGYFFSPPVEGKQISDRIASDLRR